MNPLLKRRQNDLAKLYELEKKYPFFKIQSTEGDPVTTITIHLSCSLPVSKKKYENDFLLTVRLPGNYPMARPGFHIKPKVFHPHVFESGNICVGTTWLVSTPLDAEVLRVIKLLLFYHEYINKNSITDAKAYEWYASNKHLFPLMTV